MKRIFGAVIGAITWCAALALGVLLMSAPRPARAQIVTPFYELTLEGNSLQENSTQAYCEAAAKAAGKHDAVKAKGGTAVLDCVRRLRVTGLPVATVPVVVPPIVAPTASSVWVVGESTSSEPTTPVPVRGVATVDPSFKQAVFRVSDRADPPSGFARNDYSRRQAFNAGNTRQLVSAKDGFWHTYDANTFAHQGVLKGLAGDAEPQWHPTTPDLLYYLPTNGVGMRLNELNVSTGASRVVADFAARLKARWPSANAAWTKSEGSPSADGRYWCFMVDTSAWASVGVFTWDRDTDSILGMLDTAGDRPDHVSMSPSGNYCVVSGDSARGTVAYSRDFKASTKLLAKSEHSDLALAANGDDVYVSVDYQSGAGDVFMVNIRTGERTTLFPSYLAGSARAFHFSGKAFGKPGFVLMSAYGEYGGTGLAWMDRKITLIELKANPKILNVAWHRTKRPEADGYFFESHASISRDASRVAFGSSWGSTADKDINAYQVRLVPLP